MELRGDSLGILLTTTFTIKVIRTRTFLQWWVLWNLVVGAGVADVGYAAVEWAFDFC